MSEVKVNKISPRSGTEVTLGDSGDTFTIPSGATINNQGTATNFGATGSASWVTTVKTSGFTAVAGEGYFVNTTGGAVSVNLPAGTAGAVVAFKDYANTFDTNNLTLVQNGSDKIGGSTDNATIATEGLAVTLVFVDSTQGWLVTDSGLESEAPTTTFVSATGGTITTCGNFKLHTFTGPGTFAVTGTSNTAACNAADYLVVAGGASGGGDRGGGGGGGGFRYFLNTTRCAPTSGAPAAPLNGYGSPSPSGTVITLATSPGSYPIVVGGGGAASSGGQRGNNGTVSTFSTVTSAGGGSGGGCQGTPQIGGPGGSGGGARDGNSAAAGSGNTPSTTPAQGTNGGASPSSDNRAAGGGGAMVAGGTGAPPAGGGGAGGGLPSAITHTNGQECGSYRFFSGGGEGGDNSAGTTAGGGVGGGGPRGPGVPGVGVAGTANTGGGSGGNNNNTNTGAAGGSGIVIIRYKFQ